MEQAWINHKGASPHVIQVSPPRPEGNQILVRMRAAALNFADLLMLDGQYQDTPAFPFVPGLEGAGEIVSAPPDSQFSIGDRVAYLGHGAIARQIVTTAEKLIRFPDALDWKDAAGFQIAYGTSHLALTARAGLNPGELLLVLGASGGVGQTAVELGAALGAKVIGLARGADRAAATQAAGAHIAIDTTGLAGTALQDAIRDAARQLGHEGVDVLYDPVGDAPGLDAFRTLKRGGRHLLIGFAAGKPPALPLNHALVKNIAIHGFYWGGYQQLDPELLRTSLDAAFALAEQGLINPKPGLVMPLSQIAESYEMLRKRRQIGKLVITL